MKTRIITNRAQCKKCRDIIESKYTWNFVMCSCKSIGVDGGHSYLRRIGNFEDIIELSEVEEIEEENDKKDEKYE